MNLISTSVLQEDMVDSCLMATKARLEANKRWRLANPEKYKASIKAWNDRNPEKRRAYVKKWVDSHPEYAEQRRKLARERGKSPEAKAWVKDYYRRTPFVGNWATSLVLACKNSKASKKFGPPTITPEMLREIWEAQGGRCFWSGLEMVIARNHPWKVSLDRLDNDKGYEPGNVCLATWFMNRARGQMTVEQFRTSLLVVAANIYEAFDEPDK